MIRIIVAIALFCAGCICLHHAFADGVSAPIAIGPIGQSTALMQFPPQTGGGGSYVGPGNINSGALAWWGLRCYSGTYSGNAFLLTDSSTGNTTASLAQCSGGTISFATGTACSGPGVPSNTCSPIATTCAVACNVYEIFDQSGNTNCTTACNAIEATNADRPTFTQSGCAGLSGGAYSWCVTFPATGTHLLASPNFSPSTSAQPFTAYAVSYAPSGTTGYPLAQEGEWIAGWQTSSGTSWSIYAGTQVNTSGASLLTWYAWQTLFNGASSSMYINGTLTSSLSPGTNGVTNGQFFVIGQDGFDDNGNIVFLEGGVWSGDKSANYSALNSNIIGTANGWGF